MSGLRGAVVAPSREAAAGQEFTLSDLEDCSVYLLAPLAALFLHRLRRCRVYTGPVAGACFVEGARLLQLLYTERRTVGLPRNCGLGRSACCRQSHAPGTHHRMRSTHAPAPSTHAQAQRTARS